jgi:hypothetical protein
MSRLILLDSGPLGMVTNPKATGIPLDCQLWLKSLTWINQQLEVLGVNLN